MQSIDPVTGLVALLCGFFAMGAASIVKSLLTERRLDNAHRRQMELAEAKSGMVDFLMLDRAHAERCYHELGDRLYGPLELVPDTQPVPAKASQAMSPPALPKVGEGGEIQLEESDLLPISPPTLPSIRRPN